MGDAARFNPFNRTRRGATTMTHKSLGIAAIIFAALATIVGTAAVSAGNYVMATADLVLIAANLGLAFFNFARA